MSDTDFQPGESLVWENRENQTTQLTRRPVAFRRWSNPMTAVVAFGLRSDFSGEENLLSVPRSELSRPPPHLIKTDPPKEAPPSVPLEERRHALRLRFESYQEALEVVASAEILVNRAQERLDEAETELRRFAAMEQYHVDSLVKELRHVNGGSQTPANGDDEWHGKQRAERDCAAAETALKRFTVELSHAREVANERNDLLNRAAAGVLAGIIERESHRLAQIEKEAIRLRTQLRAASMIWLDNAALPIDQNAATILSSWPFDFDDPVGIRMQLVEERQKPFMELFERLVVGEINADLNWEQICGTSFNTEF